MLLERELLRDAVGKVKFDRQQGVIRKQKNYTKFTKDNGID